PTAVGKTEIALQVAEKMGGEIISCDSMAVYRGMDIGTAKPGAEEQKRVVHHMIDVADPDIQFTVADYQRQVKELIKTIQEREKLPLLAGGTGLYYQAIVDDYNFFPVESLQPVRQRLEQQCAQHGANHLFDRLQEVDPDYADKVGTKDRKRIIRALEVYELTGQPFSSLQTRRRDAYRLAAVGLYLDRARLYARIEERVDQMLSEGLVEEVEGLRAQGYHAGLNSMQALGYKQVWAYLEGRIDHEGMVQAIKDDTRRFAKRQYTWFNKDRRIQWVDVGVYEDTGPLVRKIYDIMDGQLRNA
ncbi:MAG: tRNA (adenosine(37)-N6)-dimethylallyltransferase MiaA, partial [Syntrophomonadaceae bacterium]|nr:tRNA (adenosine(37)-N6)-dimethylallyltransferase MiaA [Syntrophomonadaceae bacterium]